MMNVSRTAIGFMIQQGQMFIGLHLGIDPGRFDIFPVIMMPLALMTLPIVLTIPFMVGLIIVLPPIPMMPEVLS